MFVTDEHSASTIVVGNSYSNSDYAKSRHNQNFHHLTDAEYGKYYLNVETDHYK